MRNMQKALLNALLMPHADMRKMQEENRMTELMTMQEELKFFPFADVWNEFCARAGVPAGREWLDEVMKYETEVSSKR